jgi:hypothetical protein
MAGTVFDLVKTLAKAQDAQASAAEASRQVAARISAERGQSPAQDTSQAGQAGAQAGS